MSHWTKSPFVRQPVVQETHCSLKSYLSLHGDDKHSDTAGSGLKTFGLLEEKIMSLVKNKYNNHVR